MTTTKIYDLQWYYDVGSADEPSLYAYQLYKDENGWWTVSDSNQFDYQYDYTQEDIEWTLANLKQHDNTPYASIDELYVDEWFSTEDSHLYRSQLPPKALEWIDGLPEYEYIDNTTQEAKEYH